MQVMIDDGFVANVASTVCILEGIQRFLQIDFCRADAGNHASSAVSTK
jgi:hypothetical protein